MTAQEKAYRAAVADGLVDSEGNKQSYRRAWENTGKILGRKKEPATHQATEQNTFAWLNE